MRAGAGLPVNKGQHMMVCVEWASEDVKPGGTAGIYPVPAFTGTGFFIISCPGPSTKSFHGKGEES